MENPAFMTARTFVDGVVKNRKPFNDDEFPANQKSLANQDDKASA